MLNTKSIRQDFPIFSRQINGHPLVYLDSAATSHKPQQVLSALVGFYQHHNANVARGVHTLSEEATQMYESARRTVADFLSADPKEIIFVKNSTEALNLVAFSWGLHNLTSKDTIITSLLEHHSNLLPWRMVAAQTGAKIKYIDVDQASKIILHPKPRSSPHQYPVPVAPLSQLIGDSVKVLALSQKSNMTGALQPATEAIRLVKKANKDCLIVLDGSHSVPHQPINVKKIGADFLAFSGHKMLGPMGIGVLWGRRKILESMPPFLRGGDMISQVTITSQKFHTVPHKFEAGTPNVAGAVGLAAAIKYLQNIGLTQIAQHETQLTKTTIKKLTSLKNPQVDLIGPAKAPDRSGVVTFNLRSVHAHDVAQILDSQGVAVRSGQHCTGPLMEKLELSASVRASFYLYNNQSDINRLIKALKQVPKTFSL